MPSNYLDFEKPLVELEEKVNELKSFMEEKEIDLTEEIERLNKRAKVLQEEIFSNLEPWQILQIARHPERPTTLDYIELVCDEFIELHGDRQFSDDKALIGGIGRIGDVPVTIIGHQKGKTTKDNIERNFGMAHPEGYRKALRLMKQADKFNRPIIALINTPGAYPGVGAEERGQAEAIARNMMEMAGIKVPIIVVIIGEGGSGGALGIGVGDRVLMLEYTYYSVCSPEACAAILWKDAKEAETAAKALKITAKDLMELEIVDGIVSEPPGGAHKDYQLSAQLLRDEILKEINKLNELSPEELLKQRYNKFRKMGQIKEESEKILSEL
ncbi:acetyl-CoA carboxylase carboxyltransferase subunit alpha [Orenia metallireducens]|jgi:acetyl-CoA carboxylase carboxyl transferase subunit alpha|uniref:Acetyl-coenzyme A carboxylase carboxyl transferase subunit alpha n=1 Tax=Orenia metallireducens TaxID=1413210 RepID=A0A285HAI5_9FIRM|nr:acetyl-CoA carboxylase carboxyl transferase subunit alpha [Orenia metallireducens]PRX28944.1 acetyl-CoA carboxylase carboxyltransferase subunit alpha [Orenia metallireducens]SNY32687.1 acetyl-CoA carboxylase carboxyltransferase subunit alpha [Orenia metallireducens]